jgi:hypothetical protein
MNTNLPILTSFVMETSTNRNIDLISPILFRGTVVFLIYMDSALIHCDHLAFLQVLGIQIVFRNPADGDVSRKSLPV